MNSNKEATGVIDVSLRQAAIVAGIGLLLMTIFSLVADSLVGQGVVVPEDAVATVKNISENELSFRIGR